MVADVTVVGTGIIALSAALELADRGLQVRLLGTTHSGNASAAAGGMLAPSLAPESGAALAFALASRDRFPGFAATVSERSGLPVPVNSLGILDVALTDADEARLRGTVERPSEWVDRRELLFEEPTLTTARGAVFHPADGCVDPIPLLDAISAIVARHDGISIIREDCRELHASELGCNVLTDMENRYASDRVVLAAGAWTPLIAGAGSAVAAIQPVRGQMMAIKAAPLRHVTCGAEGYLIPRGTGLTVAGGTMEHAGFESATTPDGLAMIRARAELLCPSLAGAPTHATWAGLRPVTPDMLPIIGADPERERVIYACGHSRNGILLAPLTAEVVADLVTGAAPRYDIGQFRPGRL